MTEETNQPEYVKVTEAQRILNQRQPNPVYITLVSLRWHIREGHLPEAYNDQPKNPRRGNLWVPRALLDTWTPKRYGRPTGPGQLQNDNPKLAKKIANIKKEG